MLNHRYLLLLVAVLMLAAGCSSDQTSPLAPAIGVPMAAPGLDSRSAMIGPQGGTLTHGDVRLDVPARALAMSTRITLTKMPDGSVDLTPSGLQFQVPASLTFTLAAGTDPAACAVQRLEAPETWVTIPSAPNGATRIAPVRNFSIYQLVEYE